MSGYQERRWRGSLCMGGTATPAGATWSGCWPAWRAAPTAWCSARGWRLGTLSSKPWPPGTTWWPLTVSMEASSTSSGNHNNNCILGNQSVISCREMREMGVSVSFVSSSDPHNIAAAVNNKTKLVWLEVCSNPSLQILDIKSAVEKWVEKLRFLSFIFIFTFAFSGLRK